MESILKIENLSHKYSAAWAIRDINLNINQTGIIGLLGSNGAGKSTTMNVICGIINQTEGDVFINGFNIRTEALKAKKQLGFLPQNPPLYTDLTVNEYLIYSAELRGISKYKIKSAVDEAKERCQISHFSNRLIANLSGGYRQRLGIAQAIIHRPQLVVLDEPTNGLDPNQIIETRKLIKEIGQESTVLFSSHVMSEIQTLCSEIIMIENGQVVFNDTMDAFDSYRQEHCLLVKMENLPALDYLLNIEGISNVELVNDGTLRIYHSDEKNVTKEIVAASVKYGWGLREIKLEKRSFEDIFKLLSGAQAK